MRSFCVGWGLVGLCPGPALTILLLGLWQAFVFVAALLAGMVLFRFVPDDCRNQPSAASRIGLMLMPDVPTTFLTAGSSGIAGLVFGAFRSRRLILAVSRSRSMRSG